MLFTGRRNTWPHLGTFVSEVQCQLYINCWLMYILLTQSIKRLYPKCHMATRSLVSLQYIKNASLYVYPFCGSTMGISVDQSSIAVYFVLFWKVFHIATVVVVTVGFSQYNKQKLSLEVRLLYKIGFQLYHLHHICAYKLNSLWLLVV